MNLLNETLVRDNDELQRNLEEHVNRIQTLEAQNAELREAKRRDPYTSTRPQMPAKDQDAAVNTRLRDVVREGQVGKVGRKNVYLRLIIEVEMKG